MTHLNPQEGTCLVITAYTEGPQGPPGATGPQGPPGVGAASSLGDIPNVDTTGVTNGSVLYYSSSAAKFKADAVWTTNSLTDGGAF